MAFLTLALAASDARAQTRTWVAASHEYSDLSAWLYATGQDGNLWQAEVLCAAGEAYLVVGPVGISIDSQGGPVFLDVDGMRLQRPGRFISDAFNGWRIVADSQIIDALRSGRRLTVDTPHFGTAVFGLAGSSSAIASALAGCSPGRGPNPEYSGFFEFSGMVGGVTLDMPLTMPAAYVEQAAKSMIETTCGGAADFDGPGAVQAARIDSDDDLDIVIDWGRITCVGRPYPRGGGYCGMQYCSAMVFATRGYRPGSQPQTFLHIGFSITPDRPARIMATRTDGGGASWIWRVGRLVPEN